MFVRILAHFGHGSGRLWHALEAACGSPTGFIGHLTHAAVPAYTETSNEALTSCRKERVVAVAAPSGRSANRRLGQTAGGGGAAAAL